MTLKDKRKKLSTQLISNDDLTKVFIYLEEDVKNAILEFQKEVLEKEIYDENLIYTKYKQIFGDFTNN